MTDLFCTECDAPGFCDICATPPTCQHHRTVLADWKDEHTHEAPEDYARRCEAIRSACSVCCGRRAEG